MEFCSKNNHGKIAYDEKDFNKCPACMVIEKKDETILAMSKEITKYNNGKKMKELVAFLERVKPIVDTAIEEQIEKHSFKRR